ncbi:DUF4885 family protein [Paenibacillus sp. YYML68]|uniref:DUF4885 family protein n=1 Tax=Paenibacillus sp. YYML68 TaxID=2909250 RepID=UPI0024918ECB|nr:DUF4885 family protein [Paenibacillus sp. YYML68]
MTIPSTHSSFASLHVSSTSLSKQPGPSARTESTNDTVVQSRNKRYSDQDRITQKMDEHYQRMNQQNMSFSNPANHIADKYQNPLSPFFKKNMTEQERRIAASNEFAYLKHGKLNTYDMGDYILREERPINVIVESEIDKAYNRQQVNGQLKQLLDKNSVHIPDGVKLTFTIDPNNYRLMVSGTEDEDLRSQLELVLNSGRNSKELFFHIIGSRAPDSEQFTQEKYEKFNLVRNIQTVTGYHLKDLSVVNGKFVTEDGSDIFDIFVKSYGNHPYTSKQDAAHAAAYYGPILDSLARRGFDAIPDLILSVNYENGSLYDIGQSLNYGTGRTSWIDELKEQLGVS